ncbi:hypothetical protein VTN96DRAFT_9358 [Rasamsonia emersonii]
MLPPIPQSVRSTPSHTSAPILLSASVVLEPLSQTSLNPPSISVIVPRRSSPIQICDWLESESFAQVDPLSRPAYDKRPRETHHLLLCHLLHQYQIHRLLYMYQLRLHHRQVQVYHRLQYQRRHYCCNQLCNQLSYRPLLPQQHRQLHKQYCHRLLRFHCYLYGQNIPLQRSWQRHPVKMLISIINLPNSLLLLCQYGIT